MNHLPEGPHKDPFNGNPEQSSSSDVVDKGSIESSSFVPSALSSDIHAKDLKMAEWGLAHKVHRLHEQELEAGLKNRELGVTWRNLNVEVPEADSAINHNVISQFDLKFHLQMLRHQPPQKKILINSHGCVKPGEMLLVLGRPGSGCSTLLKLLANRRGGYHVNGDVHFGTMNSKEAEPYRGQIVMNTEEEIFFPTLTVGDTMDFATKNKVLGHPPSDLPTAKHYREDMKEFLLESLGISHTSNTKVGNEYIRGVSGGERKRVSIIECMATRGSVFCWDNSTRGLDASSALDWAKCIRSLTDTLGLATIVTLYQAGNAIFDLFDKVLVMDEGEEIYYGPMTEARPFLENAGFVCREGANVADYLTGVTVPTEREIQAGHENSFPRSAGEIRALYEASSIFKQTTQEEEEYPSTAAAKERTEAFQETIAWEKHRSLGNGSVFTVSLYQQILACIVRQYQIIWNDKATFAIQQVSGLVQALIVGSLFYNAPANSSGLFLKSGSMFFAILYNAVLTPMSEVVDSFTGRPVLIKHKHFAFFHPAAFCVAQIFLDVPIAIFQLTVFSLVLYFMTGLEMNAANFFTYWITLFAVTMCQTQMFRGVGALFTTFDGASKVSGFLVTALVVYAGYMIARPSMHMWFGWIFYVNPMAYAFESLAANEFHGKTILCAGTNLIPNGDGYNDSSYQACSGVPGATLGATFVTGDQYLDALSYSADHIWRNFGIIWAFWAFNVLVTVGSTMLWSDSSESGSSRLIPYEKRHHHARASDEESQFGSQGATKIDEKDQSPGILERNSSVFTWKDLTYTVSTPTGDRVLLDKVYGWVQPGSLTALMGSSGAGKTTLLDVLAQRKTEGTIHGSVLVDGRPLPVSFQRSSGYCEQLDVHEPYATVREALEFSALLRQPEELSKGEKLAYVDTIIDLLELHDIADTLIGQVGAGLSIEQRKRVTIGVELVSKPKILIFLDEPTSGLDGQSAFNTVRFLRRLADYGQAVLVTIHQPSAQLFSQFDNLLLLAKGGKMVYFGEIGQDGSCIKEYFGKLGAPCPPKVNPAEYMIDVVSGNIVPGVEWHQKWLESPQHAYMAGYLQSLISDAAARPPGFKEDHNEFATSLWTQTKIVTQRMNISMFRNTDYVNNKFVLHVILGLFNGFTFWKIGETVTDLQLRLFAIYNVIFISPGVISQLQPLFIARREIYDAREKKSRMYSWKAFVTGLIVSEFPYLCICAVLYYVCFYYTVGFPTASTRAGASFFVIWLYEFIYTGMGQAIAAFAPNATFAALANPLILGTIFACCGLLVPYSQITVFWRYWLYYLNPFTYVSGSLLVFNIFGVDVQCAENEFALFDPPSGQTCESYLGSYLLGEGSRSNLINPTATQDCRVCEYRTGNDYLYSLNLKDYFYGWRDAAICVIFVLSSYGTVYLMMKAKTKASKKAE
jgi:ABC-type multidrug transport system ATPase subunit/ABC-type multidrug transport system permease subunit